MPWYKLEGGWVHIHGKQMPRPCAVCAEFSSKLCDWKLPNGKTCDIPVCDAHAFQAGTDKDLCPWHEGAGKAWLAGRTNSTEGIGP